MIKFHHIGSGALRRIAAVTVLALIGAHGSASADAVSKVTGNGAYAYTWGYDSSGCMSLYVEVSRTGSKAAPQTWLYYSAYDVCAQRALGFGYGNIPNAAFKTGSKQATLNIRVAPTTTFYSEGPAGAISLTFTPDGAFEQTYSGHWTVAWADLIVKAHGSWSSTSATVSGTVITTTFDGASGQTGESRDKQIQFERSPK
jgi:hypothetical protein